MNKVLKVGTFQKNFRTPLMNGPGKELLKGWILWNTRYLTIFWAKLYICRDFFENVGKIFYRKWYYYPPDPKFTANGTILPFVVIFRIYRKWHYYPPSLRPYTPKCEWNGSSSKTPWPDYSAPGRSLVIHVVNIIYQNRNTFLFLLKMNRLWIQWNWLRIIWYEITF